MDGPIVVGTDGSETATAAVLEAIRMASAFNQPLHIVAAYRPDNLKVSGLPDEFANAVTPSVHVEAVIEDVASRARQAGVKVEGRTVQGDPAEAIIKTAEDVAAAVIVVGNKGIGSLKRFMLGNVPSKIVHHAPCSTYVVHTTEI